MMTPAEEEFIARHAYVPEHLPGYGKVFSGGEPFLFGDFLCYLREGTLIFVGYPLKETGDERGMKERVAEAVKKFQPSRVALLAPACPDQDGERKPADQYYRLDLRSLRVPQKVRNMIQRAGRELRIGKTREFLEDHRRLVDEFLTSREVEEGTRVIFTKIGDYLSSVPTAWIFEARDSRGRLAGFDVADFAAGDYTFYLFNFRARTSPVPGTSDLLLEALVRETKETGKSFVNLGLGINEGVAFFKKKWGGRPFLSHEVLIYRPAPPSIFDLLMKGLTGKC